MYMLEDNLSEGVRLLFTKSMCCGFHWKVQVSSDVNATTRESKLKDLRKAVKTFGMKMIND